jgi:phosphoribosylglycinamide formyltransferase 1
VKSLVIAISGRGSNMQALVEAVDPARIAAVISNKPEAPGLAIAKKYGLETRIVDARIYSGSGAFDAALAKTIDAYAPDLIALAGFMRILGEDFVNRYSKRLVNIHPSLLPAFPGLDTHARALRDGVKIHGCTVHFVTSLVDHGPIIAQSAIQVLPEDTEETLARRVLEQEHRLYPQAVRWLMEGRVKLSEDSVEVRNAIFDQSALFSPGLD